MSQSNVGTALIFLIDLNVIHENAYSRTIIFFPINRVQAVDMAINPLHKKANGQTGIKNKRLLPDFVILAKRIKIGPKIRRIFGPYEALVAETYRRLFVNLRILVKQLSDLQPKRILEVGCGEGTMTSLLSREFPDAIILATDIIPEVGRLYRGPKHNVHFRKMDICNLAAEEQYGFDLVLLCDVIHHVPEKLRSGLLRAISEQVRPHGVFIFKDWERKNTCIHIVVKTIEKWITGDDVSYLDLNEMDHLLREFFPYFKIQITDSIPPWSQNRVFRLTAPEHIAF